MRPKKGGGFTIVELLVVMFIISLISASILAGYWRTQDKYCAVRVGQKLAADLRRVQNMALSGKIQDGQVPSGYGLYTISSSRFVIFYNIDSNKVFNNGSVTTEAVTLEGGVLSPVGSSIFFVPPDPTTYIDGVASGSKTFNLNLSGFNEAVTVYSSGRIEIE